MSSKSPLNVLEMVAVSTNVPDTNATPNITATPVSRKRTCLAQIPLSVTFHMWLRAQALHLVEHGVGVGCEQFVDDRAVGEEHHPVRVARGDGVVGDHDDRLTQVVDGLAHEGEDLRAGARVEVAGGFVSEDERRLAEQCATN